MSEHEHHGHHGHQHGHGHSHGDPPPKRGLHKDWRLWLVVLIMLGAMAAYILTLDESFWPGSPPQPSTPASAAP